MVQPALFEREAGEPVLTPLESLSILRRQPSASRAPMVADDDSIGNGRGPMLGGERGSLV